MRRVLGGFAAVTLGEWVLGTTIAVHAYAVGGAVAVGLVGFRFAAAALAGLWTTQLAEHAQRHRVLALTAAARAATTGAATAALALGLPFGVVIALVWLDAAAGSGYRPAQAALLPTLTRTPGELTGAVGLLSNVKSTGQMVGALLGGVLVAALPIAVPTACVALLYSAAMALTLGAGLGRGSRPAHPRLVGLGGLLAGATTLRGDREARVIVLYGCLRSLVRGLWLALAVVASLRAFSLGRSGLGVLMAAAAIGAVVAIAVTARLVGNPRLAGWFAGGLLLCGLPLAAAAPAGAAALPVAMMILWGIGMSLSDVGAQALLNRIVPASSIGAVTGVSENAKLMCEGLGSLMAPVALVALGTRGAVLATGLALPVLVVLRFRDFPRVDDRAVARIEVLELLRGVPFFAPLRLDALEGVAAGLRLEHHRRGAEIVRQGDVDAHRWFLVGGGRLAVEVDGYLVGELRRGGQFGERSLLRGVPRSATVRALTDVELYGLERDDFLTAVGGGNLDGLGAGVAESRERLDAATALARAPLLHAVRPAELDRLAERSHVREVDAGAAIVTSGERDDTYHVLLSGAAQVFVEGAPRRELHVGDAFGEIAVLHRVPRTASVIASRPSSVLTVDGEAVRAAVRVRGGALGALAG